MIKSFIKNLNHQFSSVQYITGIISRAENLKNYNSLTQLFAEESLEKAKESDIRRKKNQLLSPIDGVPIIVKDNIYYMGKVVSANSKVLQNYIAPFTATALSKIEEQGGIILAKSSLDEFAMGSFNLNSPLFPPPINPYSPKNDKLVCGGSSGGSSAAVALELSPFALGTDTGGSVRVPAAFCGVVGYKPTYGLISRYGVIPLAESLDTVGICSKYVEDVSILLNVIGGKDLRDDTSIDLPNKTTILTNNLQRNSPLQGLTVGLLHESLLEGIHPCILNEWKRNVDIMVDMGANVKIITIPFLPSLLALYQLICSSEASSSLSKYDGQKFSRINAASDSEARSKSFGNEVKRRIILGAYVRQNSALMQKIDNIKNDVQSTLFEIFQEVNMILLPTVINKPCSINVKMSPLEEYNNDLLTLIANLGGIPAVSVPVATDTDDLPISLQIMGNYQSDFMILEVAQLLESKAVIKRPTLHYSQ